MKLEQLIVQYLYSNKKVSIQDIGTFTISPDVIIPAENEKETALPENAIQFEFNAKELKDDGLIDYIINQSRKIRPLASADLESYSLLSRQFLNIGKPMIIEGIGTLQKNQQGSYEFAQGQTVNPKMTSNPVTIKENVQDEISFSTPAKEPSSGKGIMLLAIAIFLLITAGALYYFFVLKNSDLPEEQTELIIPAADSIENTMDTTALLQKDTTLGVNPIVDSSTFKIVIKNYPSKEAANKAFERLSKYGHKLIVTTKDSVTYQLKMSFTTPLSDTLRAKDSLRIFFGGKPYIEL